MSTIKSLCVYCGSSNGADPVYREAARRLGTLMAERGVRLVYGGRRVGLMGAVAHAVMAGGGAATGVIPRFIVEHEKNNPGAGELSMGLAGAQGTGGAAQDGGHLHSRYRRLPAYPGWAYCTRRFASGQGVPTWLARSGNGSRSGWDLLGSIPEPEPNALLPALA